MKLGLRSGGFWLLGFVLLALALTPSLALAAACQSAPSGLVGWWAGDGSAVDFAGTNNGTLQSGATATATGMVGTGFTFDGATSYVQIPDAPALKPTNLTVEAWVKFASLSSTVSGAPAGEQFMVFKQNSRNGSFEGYYLGKTRISSSDHFTFQVSSPSGATVELDSVSTVSTGVWYHVAAVRGTNFVQLYVNGALEVQSSVSFAQDYGTLPLYFGTSGQSFWDGKLNGMLDEVSLYNRALSSNEVAAVFAAGAAGKCKAPGIVTPPQSQTINVGSNALFTVGASGFGTLKYQWRFNNVSIAGATNTSFTVNNAQTTNAGSYAVVVTNTLGAITSPVATLTVLIPPSITAEPQNVSSECGNSAGFSVTAAGTAPLAYQWYFNGGAISGATTTSLSLNNVHAPQQGNYTVVVTNVAGSLTSSPAAVLTVVDTTPPVVTVLGANPLTIECHTAFTDPGATASDTCAGAVGVTTNNTVNANAVGAYTIKYVATDGSNSTTNTRTVIVVDTTAPIITINGANPLTNECHAAFSDPGASANDTCAGSLGVSANSTVNPNAPGIYTITYTVTDPSGNSATNTRTVYIVDKTAPVITMNGANPLTNECHTAFTDPGATANDSCAGSLGVSANSTVNPNAVGTYAIKYTATDPSGNSVTNTRTVVIVDTTAPIITINGANPLTNECHAAFSDPGASANDSCAGSLSVSANSTVNPNAPGIYTITYTVTDPNGNSTTNTRTVYIVDTTAPTITMNGANPLTNECHTAFTDPGATANDSCAGSLGVSTSSTVNPNAVGTYAIKYTATDPSGNSVTNTRTVVIVDTTAPILTINGANPLTNECHAVFSDPGASANDSCAGSLGVSANSTVNPNAPGIYTITYTAADPSGNSATNTRTVYIVDTTAPTITMNGANPMTNECHTAFTDPGATANDTCAGSLGVTANSTVNPNAVGVYSIVYIATDPSGNSVTNTRTVYIKDTTAPIVTLNGANPMTNECHVAFVDPGATASDSCAGSLGVTTSGTVNANATGIYTLSYVATDPSGNSTTNTRTVYVVDTTAPVITLNGANPVTNECHAVFADPGATASDSCAGSLSVTTNSTVNANAVGVYTITYTATDPSGNSVTNTRSVYVMDTTAPVVTLNGANPLTNECHVAFVDPGATASDSCAGSLSVTTNSGVNANAPGVYTISYSAIDPSGNATTNTRTVYVVDRTPPVITIIGPNPLTNECHAAFNDPGATANDSCAGALSVGSVSTVNPNAVGVYAITYTTIDPSGNSATNTRTVYVTDTTKPSIISAITNLTLTANANCQAVLPDLTSSGFIVAADSCSSVTITQFPVAGTIYSLGTTNSVALTAVDSSGNASNRFVSVIVPAAPSILTQPTNQTVIVSNNVTLSVSACGVGQLRYQWQHASTNLPSATNSFLALTTVRTNDSGNYAVVITNNAGAITSQVAVLTVFPFGIITDPNLNALVMSLLGKTTCDVSALDLINLTNLYAANANVTNLTGLAAATNLTTLYLGGNAIKDLTPLQGLTGLTTLFVQNNQVTNLAPLAGLTNLTYLDARWNPMTNQEAILGGMTGLSELYLGGNTIASLGFLQNLTSLKMLGLDHTTVPDVSSLALLTNLVGLDISYCGVTNPAQVGTFTNLNILNLSGNSLSNVTFASSLTRLTSLTLCSNSLSAITPLAGLPNLTSLHLGGNRAITSYSTLSSLPALSNLWASGNGLSNATAFQALNALNYLNLDDNAIKDPSPLANLTRLKALSVERNLLTNGTALSGLTNLASVWLGGNLLTNVSFLQNLTRLGAVELDGNFITNVSSFASLSQLTSLSIKGNRLTDCSPLANLVNLFDLRLGAQSGLSDLSFAANLTRLTYLDLDSNQIADLSPLAGLTGVTFLDLNTNQVTVLAPLAGMTNLTSLSLQQNRLTDISVLTALPRLSSVDVRLNLLDLSAGSAARSAMQSLVTRCPPASILPAQPDLAPTQRTAPTITLLTSLATLNNGTWPLAASTTSTLSFQVSDSGPANQKLNLGARSSNEPLIPSASLVPTLASNINGSLNVTPTTNLPNTAILTLSVTNDVGLSTNVTVSVTVITPQTVVLPDTNLAAAVRATLGKAGGTLTTLDMMSLIDLSASAKLITNLTGLEYAANLSTLDVLQNSITDIHSITNLPRLVYVNLVWNLLDLSANSAAMKAITILTNRNAVVLYLPQRTAPTITASSSWAISPGRAATLFFTVSDTVASSAQLKVGANSSNQSVIPNANLSLARYIYDPYWTMTATPVASTGSTIVTLSATNEVGLVSTWPVTVTILTPVPLAGGPLDNWSSSSWLTSANAPWFVQTNYTRNGTPAAQSGAIGDGQESWLQTTVSGPGTLSYWTKVSSESGFDFLEFYINNVLQTNLLISGEVDWQQQVINLPAGSQLLRWEYSKDNSGKSGLDAGWLSEVTFVLSGLRMEIPAAPANGQALLILHGTVGNHYEIDVSTNLQNWNSIVTLTNTATNTGGAMPYTDVFPPSSPRRYYRAKQLP